MLLRISFVLRGFIPDSQAHKNRSDVENNVLQQQLSAQIQQGEPSTIKWLSRHEHVALLTNFTQDLYCKQTDPIPRTTELIQE